MKPTVFIGSSVEQLEIAYAIQQNLEHTCDCTVWDQGVFELTSNSLDDLLEVLDRSDFGVFVFGSEDLATIRDETFRTTRDNIVFEFGLFIGRLGKQRTFFVVPRKAGDFRLPSDLAGITPASFDAERADRQAALGPACQQMRTAIKKHGLRMARLEQPTIEQVPVNQVLCLSSPPYEAMGADQDIAILEGAFPGRTVVRRGIGMDVFQSSLAQERAEIVHLLVDVDPNTGDLLFRDTVHEAGTRAVLGVASSSPQPDRLPRDGFAKLIELAQPRLLVLATCDAAFLASKISRYTNTIAATGSIPVDTIVRWARSFYQSLAMGLPLSKAHELAEATSQGAVVLHLKKDFVVQGAAAR